MGCGYRKSVCLSSKPIVLPANAWLRGFVDPSCSKLDRRVKEFLLMANPREREDLEAGRSELILVLQEARRELKKKHPTFATESMQSRRQRYKAKTKAACRAFTERAYEYSRIMDMLAGQAPEYVALAWGAIKIILILQINHEELKEKIHEHIRLIKSKFEIMDHLTILLPRANLVAAIARAYELFSRFLAESVKYYSMNKFSKTILCSRQMIFAD